MTPELRDRVACGTKVLLSVLLFIFYGVLISVVVVVNGGGGGGVCVCVRERRKIKPTV